jgi:hypothetical protein
VFNFYAAAARIGIMMTGRNVASGARDHETMAERRYSDGWHYLRSEEVGMVFVQIFERDIQYGLMIGSGGRTFQHNLAEAEMGVTRHAADATGKRIGAKDARGIGSVDAEIRPPRWAPLHEGVRPPDKWCTAFATSMSGDALDAPMDVPWELMPGVMCDPDAVVSECTKPAFRDPAPPWPFSRRK